MSDYTAGDRVAHPVYGPATVLSRARRTTGYETTNPARVRLEFDDVTGPSTTTVLKSNLTPTTERAD